MSVPSPIQQAIYDAIDRINETQDSDRTIEKSPDTVLAGEDGKLDSLGFVNLAVTLEQTIQQSMGRSVSVFDLVGGVPQGSLTVASLVEMLAKQLQQPGSNA